MLGCVDEGGGGDCKHLKATGDNLEMAANGHYRMPVNVSEQRHKSESQSVLMTGLEASCHCRYHHFYTY